MIFFLPLVYFYNFVVNCFVKPIILSRHINFVVKQIFLIGLWLKKKMNLLSSQQYMILCYITKYLNYVYTFLNIFLSVKCTSCHLIWTVNILSTRLEFLPPDKSLANINYMDLQSIFNILVFSSCLFSVALMGALVFGLLHC